MEIVAWGAAWLSTDSEERAAERRQLGRRKKKGTRTRRTQQQHALTLTHILTIEEFEVQRVDASVHSTPSSPATTTHTTAVQTDPVFHSLQSVEDMQEQVTILDGHIYDVSRFLDVHPGGRIVLEPFLGVDSTKVYRTFSCNAGGRAAHMLNKMWVGQVEPPAALHTPAKRPPLPRRAPIVGEESAAKEWPLSYEGLPPRFIMTVGIPGSGKSTWARQYVATSLRDTTLVSADAVRLELAGSFHTVAIEGEVWGIVWQRVCDALAKGVDVVLDATNTISHHRACFVHSLPPCTAYARVFTVSKEEALRRIKNDILANVSRQDVPPAVLAKMLEHFSRDVSLLREDGLLVMKDDLV